MLRTAKPIQSTPQPNESAWDENEPTPSLNEYKNVEYEEEENENALDPLMREIMQYQKKYGKRPPPLTTSGTIDRSYLLNTPPQVTPLPFPSPPPANDKDECQKICYKYHINNGQTYNEINTYGGWSHVEVYREVVDLIHTKDDFVLKMRCNSYGQNKGRDIKVKIKSDGKIRQTKRMLDGIYIRIKALQGGYFGYDNNTNNGDEFGDELAEEFDDEFDDNNNINNKYEFGDRMDNDNGDKYNNINNDKFGDEFDNDNGNNNNNTNNGDQYFSDMDYDNYNFEQYDYCFMDAE